LKEINKGVEEAHAELISRELKKLEERVSLE